MDVLDMLAKQGDQPTVARPVEHWLYFPSDAARSLFENEVASKLGFSVCSESKVEGNLPFGVMVGRVETVEQRVIDETVLQLFRLSKRFSGEYDGWGTKVIK